MSATLQYLVDEAGVRRSVILPVDEYERMVEDLADLAVDAERRTEPGVEHSEFLEELRRDGLLPH